MRIDSQSARYPGYVILPDNLTFPQAIAWEAAVDRASEADGKSRFEKIAGWVPGIIACVQEWHIEGFPTPLTVDNFPASPSGAVLKLINPIIAGVTGLLFGEDEAKNA